LRAAAGAMLQGTAGTSPPPEWEGVELKVPGGTSPPPECSGCK